MLEALVVIVILAAVGCLFIFRVKLSRGNRADAKSLLWIGYGLMIMVVFLIVFIVFMYMDSISHSRGH